MPFDKRSKSRKTVTSDLPEEESAEFGHGGNENQCGKEKIGGKKKGVFIRRLKRLISKRSDCAPKESKRYDEHESKRCDDDGEEDDSNVLDLHHDDDDYDDNSSVLDLHNDDDSTTLDLHHDNDEDDDNSEDLDKKAQHDHTSLMRSGENANQMCSPGNTHAYPANNMYAYPDYNSAYYHPYAYSSYNPNYNTHAYAYPAYNANAYPAYNANAYPAYNSAYMHGDADMHEYPTNNMNMPSNSVPPLDHTFTYFTQENPACAIM